jgi:hypothetical protein
MTADSRMLARIERRAAWLTVVAAAAAFLLPRGGASVTAGVFGGAVLSALSYWAIKRGVTGLTDAVVAGAAVRPRTARALIILVGRYGLLALIAYVMIARLRLSPMGLLTGASVVPASVAIEALATLRQHGKV